MTLPAIWNENWTAALVNHLWQSTAVVCVAWLLALTLRKNHARVRYLVWMAASLKFMLPFSILMTAGEWVWKLILTTAVVRPAVAGVVEQVTLPFAGFEFSGVSAAAPVAVHHVNLWPWILLAVWVGGAFVVLARFARGWWRVYAAVRGARAASSHRSPFDSDRFRDLGSGQAFDSSARGELAQDDTQVFVAQDDIKILDAGVPVVVSAAPMEPGIVGIFRPVLLVPEGILERLTAEQMRAIVAHEMAHVRRRDNLTFALHKMVETLFWFHPAVWWIGSRLVEERELACDEAVVEKGGAAQAYAEGILNVCKFYVESPVECVAGVTGADLKKRIARIMTQRKLLRLDWPKKLALAAVVLTVIAVPLALGLGRAAQTATASTTDIVGIWQGSLHAPQGNRELRTEIKIAKNADGSYKLTFYSIDQGGQPFVADKTTFEDGKVSCTLEAIGGTYAGAMSADGKTIAGTWTQGKNPLPLNLTRTTEDAAWPIPEQVKPMSADAHPTLEVATVKPSKPGARGKGFGFNGTHFKAANFDVNDMIAIGFGLHSKQIVGAPDWLGTELYDIDGVPDVPGRPNIKQMGDILQSVLVSRFALKFHHEQRELQVYTIELAAGGPKMKETTMAPNDPQAFGFRGLGDLVVRNLSMKDFAFGMQSAVTDRPVLDGTGLTGRYDFTLKWTPDDSQFAQFRGAVFPPPAAGDNPDAPPSLYTAMQEQLGLKIEAGKAMDDVIVIDHIERPGAN